MEATLDNTSSEPSEALGRTKIWGPYKQFISLNLTFYSLGNWMIFFVYNINNKKNSYLLLFIVISNNFNTLRNLGAPKNRGPKANVYLAYGLRRLCTSCHTHLFTRQGIRDLNTLLHTRECCIEGYVKSTMHLWM